MGWEPGKAWQRDWKVGTRESCESKGSSGGTMFGENERGKDQ